MKVSLTLSQKFPYCRCRSCSKTILWFAVTMETDLDCREVPVVSMLQAPSEKYKGFCPYCGAEALWKEDDGE